MDETDMSLEDLLDRYEKGEPVEVAHPIIALLRSIDRKLDVLIQQTRQSQTVIYNPPSQVHYPTWPIVQTSPTAPPDTPMALT